MKDDCNLKPGWKFAGTGYCGKHQSERHKPAVSVAELRASHGMSDVASPFDPSNVDRLVESFNKRYAPLKFGIMVRGDAIGEEKAISTDVLTVEDNGVTVGRLDVSYVSKENVDVLFPTPYHFNEVWHGDSSLGLYEYVPGSGRKMLPFDDDIIKQKQEEYPKTHYGRTTRTYAEVASDMQETLEFWKHPNVGFVRVDPEHQGKGVSDKLYEMAAEMYGGISASSLQTDEAQKMWGRFESSPMYEEWVNENISEDRPKARNRRGLIADHEKFDTLWLQKPGELSEGKPPRVAL